MSPMTPDDLVELISAVCQIRTPIKDNSSYEQRIDCIDYFTNCMIRKDNTIHIEDLKECSHEWTYRTKNSIKSLD